MSIFKNIKSDLPASVVVFFVALPLCLGIALASGAPLFSGLIAGIVGGIIVGILSGSKIGVSGPAAGLAAIVFSAIDDLKGFDIFLLAVVLGGVIQLILGIARAGVIAYFFPSSVIKGMLTGIGIIIIKKQIPYFFGHERPRTVGFLEFFSTLDEISLSPIIIGLVGLAILILWQQVLTKKAKIFQLVQGPVVAVVIGIVYYFITSGNEGLGLKVNELVSVPVPDTVDSFLGQFTFPDFSHIGNKDVWIVAFTIAVVASLETLLCVEATDKLDPDKNVTPTNRELFAQGAGNIVSGLIGGLPITQVIVRSSANIQSGGKTKISAVVHGFFLLISVISIPTLLNKIPLSVLAAILFVVGFKLAKPSTFVNMYKAGWKQFVPFIATVLPMAIVGDLLLGIGLGLAVGIVIILINSYQNSHFLHIEDTDNNGKHRMKITLAEEVTFFNKGAILKELDEIPEETYLTLDVRKTRYLDPDIIEILEDFSEKSKNKNIDIHLISERGVVENPDSYIQFFKLRSKKA